MALVNSALFDPEAPPDLPLGAFVVLPAALFEPGRAGLPTEAGLAARCWLVEALALAYRR